MLSDTDIYHATITQSGDEIQSGVFSYSQLRNIIVRTAPQAPRITPSDILTAAIARDGTFEMDNWRIKVSRIHR
jgi:hypothetical protein